MTDNLSAGDILAMTRDRDDDNMIWNNPFIYLVWMFVMRWFNNNNEGKAATEADLCNGLGRQDMLGNQRSILDNICNLSANMNTGFGQVRYDNLANINGLQNSITNAFYGLNQNIAENRYAQSQCCCEIQKDIANLSAENYRNTCEITNAIHSEGEATRGLITQNTIQQLRDDIAARDRELLASNLFNAQQNQTSNLINTLRPFPQPCYVTCSPYTTQDNFRCGC